MKLHTETTHFQCSIQIKEYLGNSATYCHKVKVTVFVTMPLAFDFTILNFSVSVCYPKFSFSFQTNR